MKNKKAAKHFTNRKSYKKNKADSKTVAFVFIGTALLICPVLLLILTNHFLLNAPNSAWIVIGYIGSFIIGIGLFNWIMSLNKLSLGMKFTVICLTMGIILIAISEILIFNSHLFCQDLVSFYFVSLLFCIGSLISYWVFRGGVNSYLRKNKGLSKTNINKHKKGKRNYWWYEEIQKQFGIGGLYYLNKIYTILFAVVLFSDLLLGFFKFASVFICSISVVFYILSAIIGFFGMVQYTVEEHGKAFILYAKSSSGKIDSSIFDLFFIVLPAGMIYAHIVMTVELWQ